MTLARLPWSCSPWHVLPCAPDTQPGAAVTLGGVVPLSPTLVGVGQRGERGHTRVCSPDTPCPCLHPLTPQRVAKALLFALRGYRQSPAEVLGDALFTEHSLHASTPGRVAGEGEDSVLSSSEDSEDVFEVQPVGEGPSGETGLVVVRHIDVFSTSDADLQPFFGRVHVGYLPAHGRIVGLSKTARIAEVFARRLQSPQQLCDNIAVRSFCRCMSLSSACD